MKYIENFDRAAEKTDPEIGRILAFLPNEIKAQAEEIRLRSKRPISLTIGGKSVYVTKNGGISQNIGDNLLIASEIQVKNSFLSLCNHSVYDHAEELSEGFISTLDGNRVGVCGRLLKNGSLGEISSLNIRLAHEALGAADGLLGLAEGGLLLAGPPSSGKTTVLRDLVRQISNSGQTVSVIDNRGELWGGGKNDLGFNTDVIKTSDKAAGIQIALRTLSPRVIAFDEIGTLAELSAVSEGFCAGVTVVTTAHCGDIEDLKSRAVCQRLLQTGAINKVALLSRKSGVKLQIFSAKELFE